uniref:KH domain-containing protein At4g18375-like isoform X2 n=1 Tax=Albuca bracteata TaxID=82047 RepID=A0A0A7LU74_ALBBR|nr:KH domain-containing protein At4g18375-like isoform X2 [Albuca bracteata]
MAGQRNSYGKRSHSHGDHSDHGGSKRRNPGDDRDTYTPGPDDTVYRYLCPGKKIGSIIGRGGEIVKQLRADTQAKIRIGETVPGCDERVITIFSTSKETNSFEDSDVCPAQEALFKVHERLVSDEGMDEDNDEGGASQVTARLLVPSDQIGCIIGKGGQIIQGIRSDSGAQIRILKNEHLPACAISSDELLQITGDASVVRKALFQVSSRLHDNPSRSNHLLTSNMPSAHPSGGQYGGFASTAPVVSMGPLMGSYGGYKADAPGDWPTFFTGPRDESSSKEFSLRLLCPSVNIGGVIGRGGGIIKQIRQESGAYIKVDSSSAEDDCIITVSAKECFEDPVSQAIDAAVRLQPRCSEKTERESGESQYTTRLLVPTSRIGCLIGKGGTIISEMRRITRANIRILSKENLPKVAAEDDEMVQISGDLDVARMALIQVTIRLKANYFERESALSTAPAVPFTPILNDDMPKYSSRDSKSHSRGYSSYSGGYGSADVFPSEPYGTYGAPGGGGSSYGSYGGYSSRSGGAGLSNPVSHGKHHGY